MAGKSIYLQTSAQICFQTEERKQSVIKSSTCNAYFLEAVMYGGNEEDEDSYQCFQIISFENLRDVFSSVKFLPWVVSSNVHLHQCNGNYTFLTERSKKIKKERNQEQEQGAVERGRKEKRLKAKCKEIEMNYYHAAKVFTPLKK